MRSRVANTIAISRQFALPQLRKRAFYLLLAEPDFDNLDYTNELKAQFTAAASAADANDHAWALLYEVSAVQPTKSLLSADDYDLLVKARRRLTEAWLTICTTFPAIAEPNPHSGPCSPQSVKDVFWTRHMIGSGIYQKYLYDPLNGIYDVSHDTEALWNSLAGWDICEMCHLRMNTFLRRRREELWTEMDTWLGL
ncbi:hypothetical protein PLICRDRAFT_526651 [Plicaturopsis crispa FD-325 SS-3]|nr:hypothetical protein PLICRDRAFT_526651 [Plicaturopsis crispa FD-325 SS-3]